MERRRARPNERRRSPGFVVAAAIAAAGGGLVALAGAIAAGTALASALALTLGAVGCVLAGAGLWLARRGQTVAEKASSDLDFLARRLLRVESRLAEAERRKGGDGDLRGAVAEVSGEIALISGLLRDLAGTVAAHDRALSEQAEHEEAREPAALGAAPGPGPSRREPPAEPETYPEPAYSGPAYSEPPPPARRPQPEPPLVAMPRAAPPRFSPIVEAEPEPAPAPARPASRSPAPFTPEPFPAEPFPPEQPPEPPPEPAPEPLFADEPDAAPAPDPALERRIRAIAGALRDDRIEIHLQPVVSLPQRKTRFYEALARLRLEDDEIVLPEEFQPALEAVGLGAELDGKVAARAAAIARHLVARGSDAFVTVNLAHESLAAPGFLRALGRILDTYPDVVGRLAFEIAQRSWRMLDGELAGALEALRAKGALFVLDRANDLRVDPFGLADRGVRYVKLPAGMLLAHLDARGAGLDVAVGDLSAVMARAGIKLVAEAVDREEDVPDLIDLDIPLAQGLVFGAPRAVRSDLIGGPPGRGGGGAEPPARSAPPSGETSAVAAQPRTPERPAGGPAARKPTSEREPEPPFPPVPPRPEPRVPYRATLRRAG
ncbi:EAL domain-containing protein [Salinarimonas sp.]|uniref:EAL domain-containing protein n=1 Tax=Salinarimonas sp. TaxID=2766526 RepID=UPI0032D8E9AB